ncbi:MAG: hypothetical protein U1E87_00100 [Alphaproteobacteria bacterium]
MNSLMFPSLRVAYLVAPAAAIELIAQGCIGTGRTMNFPLQAVLQDFIEHGHLASHVRACRSVFAERRLALFEALRTHFPSSFNIGAPAFGLLAQLWLPEGMSDAEARQAAGKLGGVVATAMSDHALLPTRSGLFLGFAPYEPQAIARAAVRLSDAIQASRY